MIKHMLYKKEINMEDISSVSYSIKWRGKGKRKLFLLYDLFETEYPKKTKEYRRFCRF